MCVIDRQLPQVPSGSPANGSASSSVRPASIFPELRPQIELQPPAALAGARSFLRRAVQGGVRCLFQGRAARSACLPPLTAARG